MTSHVDHHDLSATQREEEHRLLRDWQRTRGLKEQLMLHQMDITQSWEQLGKLVSRRQREWENEEMQMLQARHQTDHYDEAMSTGAKEYRYFNG